MSYDTLIKKIRAEGLVTKFESPELDNMLGAKLDLPTTPRGRMRLSNALRDKFGKNYQLRSDASDMIKKFDDHLNFNRELVRRRSKHNGR